MLPDWVTEDKLQAMVEVRHARQCCDQTVRTVSLAVGPPQSLQSSCQFTGA